MKNFTVHMETLKTLTSENSLVKEEWSWRNQLSSLQTILLSYSHQDSMELTPKQKYRSMEQDREPEINPHTYGYLIFEIEARIYNGAKTASSISGTGKTGQLFVKE